MSIGGNLLQIHQQIALAQATGVHAAKDVTLLAVSKTKPLAMITEAWQAGQRCFGENRVQELVEKQASLPEASWHLIGQLQKNKVKYLVGKTTLIHSLDRTELAEEIEKRYAAADSFCDCLVQVNIAEEDSKSGLFVPELADFLDSASAYPHLRICGLMTIGPLMENPEEARPIFAELRRLYEREQEKRPFTHFQWLSMGMSHDFAIAIQEGANIVRVGSSIFGARSGI